MEDVGPVRNGYVAADGGRILDAGRMDQLPREWRDAREVYGARGQSVLPGLVDPHTHVVHAGDRTGEFRERLAGTSYAEIGRRGGGILATVAATRAASAADLVASAQPRLRRMLTTGTTTVEAKSGYGLCTVDELKMLEAVQSLAEQPVELVATFMGGHEVPPEYSEFPGRYATLVADEMTPAAALQGIARFCDVFCEAGVFDVAQAGQMLRAGKAAGLVPRIHADELAAGGGAELAAALGARTADHLVHVSERGIQAMAGAGVMGVLLPGTSFCLGLEPAPASRMVAAGVPVALATDCNPGSCPIESMAVIIGLACRLYGFTPEAAICAATLNAAWALDLHDRIGSLEPGKQADLVAIADPDPAAIPYRFGSNLVAALWKRGRRVV